MAVGRSHIDSPRHCSGMSEIAFDKFYLLIVSEWLIRDSRTRNDVKNDYEWS